MNAKPNLERRLTDYYAGEPAPRAPDRVLLSALATIDVTPQRRGMFAPWRSQTMPTFAKLGAAVAILAVVAVGIWQFAALPGPGGPRGAPTPSPSASLAPSVPPSVSPTLAPSPVPLTGLHTSEMYGLTLSHPTGWTVAEGTETWALHALPGFGSPLSTADLIHYPANPDLLFISLSSHPLDGAESGPEWADAVSAAPDPGPCPAFDPVVVAGLEGRLYDCNEPMRALFWSADTGYYVSIYRSDDLPWEGDVYDRAWFEDLLATVELQ